MNIEKISQHKQILQPAGDQKVPVVFHVSESLMPDSSTIDQLRTVASDSRVFHHVAALADVHQKTGRRNPSGTVVATERFFLPQLLDTAPNCGMRLIKTPFGQGDLTDVEIDDIFHRLVKSVPTKAYLGHPLPLKVVLDICKIGTRAVLEYLKDDPEAAENMLMGGNMFDRESITEKDLLAALPRFFYRFGQFRLGILGAAGNHFLDLMKVTDILDEELALDFGLTKEQYVFWIHTGSGLPGQYASYFYTPKQKEHFSQKLILEAARLYFLDDQVAWHRKLEADLPAFRDSNDFYGIDSQSDLGRNYFVAHRAAANFGFANRAIIQHNLEAAVTKVLGKKNNLDLVYDMSHVYVNREKHFDKEVLVHRSNTTRALGPKGMTGTKYAKTGEPVFMPSSMSTAAYFGVGTDDNQSTFYSAAHGTGKSKTKTSTVPQDKKALLEKMKQRGVRLYNAASKGIIQQDAAHYKDPDEAVAGMVENKMIRPIAKMSPVAVLMY